MINWLRSLFCNKQNKPAVQAPAERPSISEPAKKLLRIPFAIHDKDGVMPTRGRYRKGYPEGAVVHFTAGSSIESSISWLRKSGYPCLCIGRDGTLYQNFDLDRWGYHAGTSYWDGLGSGVSQYLVGIEIAAAGKLTKRGNKWYTWFDQYLPKERTRTITKPRYKGEVPGTYEAYTPEQEETLIRLLTWLKRNNPEVFKAENIVGHDEIRDRAGKYGSKNDPGGALSMSVPDLRKKIENV